MKVAGILLAAGSSARFLDEKLLTPHRGRPLYRHALDALLAAPAVEHVFVVVNPLFPVVALPRERVTFVVNENYQEGLSSSLRAGILAAPADVETYLLALADMPGITPALVASLVEFHGRSGKLITLPVHGGRNGHPVLISAQLKPRLLEIRGDVGARGVIRENPDLVARFETDDPAVLQDVDTRADLERLP